MNKIFMWTLRLLGVMAVIAAFWNPYQLFIALGCFLVSRAISREIRDSDNQRRAE